MTYIRTKSGSWHILARLTPEGWMTRCGRCINEETPISGTLPGDERSCESCLRYNAVDEARLDVANDEVPG